MSQANPLWDAPRIHGELLKMGTDSPTAKWTGQQIAEAFPWGTAPQAGASGVCGLLPSEPDSPTHDMNYSGSSPTGSTSLIRRLEHSDE